MTTRPIVMEADSVTQRYHFRPPVEFGATSYNYTAQRRRGRFVIKMAAAMYLATLPAYDTPGKCAKAMSYLWSHHRLALEYLRRTQQHQTQAVRGAGARSYTSEELRVAEAKWKAHFGEQVLLPDGFQRSWDEIVPFFVQSIQELERDLALPNAQGDGTENGGLAVNTTASEEVEAAGQFLDLTKIHARALFVLYEKTVSHLRTVSVAKSSMGTLSTPDHQHLASRGWLPIHQILSEISPDLEGEPALKVLLEWMRALDESQRGTIYVALLTPLNVLGKLQLLHDGDWGEGGVATVTAEMAEAAPVTHLRAAWGHKDADVAAAVIQEHIPVLLNSLVHLSEVDIGDSRAVPQPTDCHKDPARDKCTSGPSYSSWLEYVADVKVIRKEAAGASGRVYPQYRPMQVLIPEPVVDALCAPLQLVRLQYNTSTATALTELIQRTRAHNTMLRGADGTVGSSSASGLAKVTFAELLALLQPPSGFCVAVFLAAMTGHAARLAFLPVSTEYFAAQDQAVSGWYMPVHMLRVSPRSANGEGRGSDSLTGAAMLPPSLMRGATAVAAPETTMNLFVCPCALTSGVLWLGDEAAPATPTRSSFRPLQPPVGCVVDFDLLYGIHTDSKSGSKAVTVRRPQTERIVNLRIASLWDIWCWYGFQTASGGHLTATDADATTPPQRLMVTERIGVVLGPKHHQPPPYLVSRAQGTEPPPSPTAEVVPREEGEEAFCQSDNNQSDRAPATDDAALLPVRVLLAENSETRIPVAAAESLASECSPLMHRLPWEFFPVAEAESTILRLDAVYRAELRCSCERWRSQYLELLRPLQRGGNEEEAVHGIQGSERSTVDARVEQQASWRACTAVSARERALWSGLSAWMKRLDHECALPSFSLLLPPDVVLGVSNTNKDARRLCSVGRKKALAALRRLVSTVDAPSLFYFNTEVPFIPPLNPEEHRMWVVENEAAWQPDTVVDASLSTSAASRGGGCWTIAAHPEVLLAAVRDEDGEEIVHMYVRQACVLLRSRTHRALAAVVEADLSTTRRSGVRDRHKEALRLCRFSRPPTGPGGGNASHFGESLEELAVHAALRHGHSGCRITPLACDEIVLGAAWPAEYIVEYALLPPLQEALEVYCAKKRAEVEVTTARQLRADPDVGSAGASGVYNAMLIAAAPGAAALQVMMEDLHRELLLVLTDEAAMEVCEFYGDALVDYCAAVTTLSYRFASSNFSIWRGGNITDSSTNEALVESVLPAVLRRYWMSRRRICNSKRLADCVESLFGALVKSLWVYPLQRMVAHRAGEGASQLHSSIACGTARVGADAVVPPDADMLVYVASALLELLSGGH
ncbi:hypothetical protein MNV84_04467 [Leishmania braziliensis]|nr:hypothetical protein MNV84_04467 [Leishmania braziliensis]